MSMHKKINKNSVYIAFPDESGNLVHEYIPNETNEIVCWLITRYNHLYIRFGIDLYYWNLRYLLVAEVRKQEDVRFIMHVLEEHDGEPRIWREKRFYKRLCRLYGHEIYQLINPLVEEKKDKNPLIHPYFLAYKKRWVRKKRANLKRMYHGVDIYELTEMIEELNRSMNDARKSYYSKKSYYRKLLGKD